MYCSHFKLYGGNSLYVLKKLHVCSFVCKQVGHLGKKKKLDKFSKRVIILINHGVLLHFFFFSFFSTLPDIFLLLVTCSFAHKTQVFVSLWMNLLSILSSDPDNPGLEIWITRNKFSWINTVSCEADSKHCFIHIFGSVKMAWNLWKFHFYFYFHIILFIKKIKQCLSNMCKRLRALQI